MSDFYRNALARINAQQPAEQPAPPAQAPQYPPTAPPGQAPPVHMTPYAYQQPAAQPHPQAPQGYQAPQQGPVPRTPAELRVMVEAGALRGTTYNEAGAMVADDGHVALLQYAVSTTGGSREVKENSTTCPECHGGNLFTVQQGGVMSKATGDIVRAQQCADCGWPKVQSGSTGGALSSARGAGPAKQARQLRPDHRVTVAVQGGGMATFDPPTRR